MDLSDPTTFQSAYERHSRSTYASAYRICGSAAQAQDVVQDVFLRLWRRPSVFDARRGDLGSYLRLMARSRALDLWRESQAAGRAQDRLKVVVAQQAPRAEEQPVAALERTADRERVRAALHVLPDAQREAVVMAFWGGLTAGEVADRSQVPLGTAKSRIRLGMARLRDELAALPEAA